ncbi:MAG: hypothetical protein GXO78_13025 [Calditrichaeota bacterium]|nr:hypothetical protein [Calditrichota bacterium]
MQVISAINLRRSKVFFGDGADVPSPGDDTWNDPIHVARELEKRGVDKLHVVDIDAALEQGENNVPIIKQIVKAVNIPVQVAGGIRQLVQIDELLQAGVDQVVLGTLAVQYPNLLYQIVRNFSPDRIAVSLDILGDQIRYLGWQKSVEMPIKIFIRLVESQGVNRIIFTDIERVHTMQGINFEKIKEIAEYTRAMLTIAGGVRSVTDIQHVEKLRRYRVDSIIIGKAIFSDNMDLLNQIQQYRQQRKT